MDIRIDTQNAHEVDAAEIAEAVMAAGYYVRSVSVNGRALFAAMANQ